MNAEQLAELRAICTSAARATPAAPRLVDYAIARGSAVRVREAAALDCLIYAEHAARAAGVRLDHAARLALFTWSAGGDAWIVYTIGGAELLAVDRRTVKALRRHLAAGEAFPAGALLGLADRELAAVVPCPACGAFAPFGVHVRSDACPGGMMLSHRTT